MRAVVGSQDQSAAEHCRAGCPRQRRSHSSGRPRKNVANESGVGERAVRRPQLPAMAAVIGRQGDTAAAESQRHRATSGAAGEDVAHQLGVGSGSLRDPEFVTMHAIVGGEIDPSPCSEQITGIPHARPAIGVDYCIDVFE